MNMKNFKPTIAMTPHEYDTIRNFIALLNESCFDGYNYGELINSFPHEKIEAYTFMIETPIYNIEIQH